MVPGGGFEPPTRRFSVDCSTPELPRHGDAGICFASGRGLLGERAGGVQRCREVRFSALAPNAEAG